MNRTPNPSVKGTLIWSPQNGHHEICYLELVEGI